MDNSFKGQYCIVRCRDAGVHAGVVTEINEQSNSVTLSNSRRLWRWWSKFTLSGLAVDGVLESKQNRVRFACVIETIKLYGWCEIIPCTSKAKASIEGVPEWKNL